jgi:hypothetical protein
MQAGTRAVLVLAGANFTRLPIDGSHASWVTAMDAMARATADRLSPIDQAVRDEHAAARTVVITGAGAAQTGFLATRHDVTLVAAAVPERPEAVPT